jgi:hypothetical protein
MPHVETGVTKMPIEVVQHSMQNIAVTLAVLALTRMAGSSTVVAAGNGPAEADSAMSTAQFCFAS